MVSVGTREVERIAELSNLRFSPEELERLVHQFQEILGYFAQLESVPTEEVGPTFHALEQGQLETPMREDVVENSLAPATALAHAPEAAEDHFRVPAVIE